MIEYLEIDNLAANAVADLMVDALTGEAQTRFVNRPSKITVALVANAVGVELQIFAGARTIVPRSTLEAGGTTGVFPNINQKAFSFLAAQGEVLRLIIREIAGVATTDIMAVVDSEPIA
ncbi:MAG: hypothetical protein V3T26_08615 [candidate division NC10 bacterium]